MTIQQTTNQSLLPWYTAPKLSDQDSLTQEPEFLTTIFKENGYSPQQIHWTLKPVAQIAKTNERPTSIAFIPYTQTLYDRLSRMLDKHIKSVSHENLQLPSTYQGCFGIKNSGCECARGHIYIRQSGQSIQIIIKVYSRHMWLAETEKNQQLQNTASTRTLLLNYRIQNFFLQKPDTWTDSSGKPLNWKCTHTTWIEKMV